MAAAPTAADPAPPVDPTSPPEPAAAALGEPSDPGEPQRRADDASAAPGDETLITRIRDAWPAILERLASSSRVAWTAFHAATPVSCTNGALAVAVAEPGNVRAIAQRGHDERLRQAIIDVLALDLTIDVLHDPEPARPALAGAGVTGSAAASAAGSQAVERRAGSGWCDRSATGRGLPPGRRPPPTARPADVVREAGSAPVDRRRRRRAQP